VAVALYPGPTTFPGPDTFTGAGPVDAEGGELPDGPAWWASADDVARIIARFTIGVDGTAGYTFDENTTPTLQQVQDAIAGVAQEVANAAGTDLQQLWTDQPGGFSARAARRVIALGTGSELVLGYYPSENAQGVAQRLQERYEAALTRLLGGGGSAPDTGGGSDGAAPATPRGGFPPAPPDPYGARRMSYSEVAW
jgi:hypothetical protein